MDTTTFTLAKSGESAIRGGRFRTMYAVAGTTRAAEVGRRRDRGELESTETMAILIRSDLPLSPGRVVNIASTIAVRLFQSICATPNSACTRWNTLGQKKVVLKISGEERMLKLIRYAREHRIPVAGVRAGFVKPTNLPSTHDSRTTFSKSAPAPKMSHAWVALGMFANSEVINGLTRGLEQY